jgi:rhamnose utilization protein RhaD (predicted bifunctional aldolase and dehydrogenase)
MTKTISPDLQKLLRLTGRVGSDPLLTQASTGNSSAKLDGVLWIKASGRWMADAIRDDILIPLDLYSVTHDCVRRGIDPSERYPRASVETAMHAALPHRFVLHVHCVNTIAWAVRADAHLQLCSRLDGMRWQWVPYAASGVPLARAIERALRDRPGADVFVLGNHGLVIGASDPDELEARLAEVTRRLSVPPRRAPHGDCSRLDALCAGAQWRLPADCEVHALATDPVSRNILGNGLLYPCQAIFSGSTTAELFHPVPRWQTHYAHRPFLIIEGQGVIVNRCAGSEEMAMLRGLAQVVQRLGPSSPVRYLTPVDLAGIASQVARRSYGQAALFVP